MPIPASARPTAAALRAVLLQREAVPIPRVNPDGNQDRVLRGLSSRPENAAGPASFLRRADRLTHQALALGRIDLNHVRGNLFAVAEVPRRVLAERCLESLDSTDGTRVLAPNRECEFSDPSLKVLREPVDIHVLDAKGARDHTA